MSPLSNQHLDQRRLSLRQPGSIVSNEQADSSTRTNSHSRADGQSRASSRSGANSHSEPSNHSGTIRTRSYSIGSRDREPLQLHVGKLDAKEVASHTFFFKRPGSSLMPMQKRVTRGSGRGSQGGRGIKETVAVELRLTVLSPNSQVSASSSLPTTATAQAAPTMADLRAQESEYAVHNPFTENQMDARDHHRSGSTESTR